MTAHSQQCIISITANDGEMGEINGDMREIEWDLKRQGLLSVLNLGK